MDTLLDIRFWSAGAGAALGEYLGSFDSLMYALVAFIITDYVTGVLCAIVERNLSSAIGFKGICQKVFILALVGVANVLDVHVVGSSTAPTRASPSLRTPLESVCPCRTS